MSRAVLFKGIALHMRLHRGFTLVELITTMIVLGILAAYAIPKFGGRHGFESRGFADQLLALLQDARRTAISQHRIICVSASGSSVTVTRAAKATDATCDGAMPNPHASGNYELPVPPAVAAFVPARSVNFDSLGRPSGDLVFAVIGEEGNFSLTIEAETGYAHY